MWMFYNALRAGCMSHLFRRWFL